jgi:hypothetical protein
MQDATDATVRLYAPSGFEGGKMDDLPVGPRAIGAPAVAENPPRALLALADAVARVVRSVQEDNPIGQSVRFTLFFVRSGTTTHDSGSDAASPLRPVVASGFARQASSPLAFCQDVPVSVP